jgi:hypothetical protein
LDAAGAGAGSAADRLAHAEPAVNATPSAATTVKSFTRIFATPFKQSRLYIKSGAPPT